MFCYFRQLLVKMCKNSFIKHLSTVSCHQYKMIVALVNTMRKICNFHTAYYTPTRKMQGELHPSTLRSGYSVRYYKRRVTQISGRKLCGKTIIPFSQAI